MPQCSWYSTYVPVHLPGQSGSRVSLPSSLNATTDLSGSALGSVLREEPPDPPTAQRGGKDVPRGMEENRAQRSSKLVPLS